MDEFIREHLDVLQNLEFAIVEVYRTDRSLLDFDAKDAIDAVIRHYHAEEVGRRAPVLRIGGRARRVFETVQEICLLRLGRTQDSLRTPDGNGIPLAELIKCLRQIQKSIPRWT